MRQCPHAAPLGTVGAGFLNHSHRVVQVFVADREHDTMVVKALFQIRHTGGRRSRRRLRARLALKQRRQGSRLLIGYANRNLIQ